MTYETDLREKAQRWAELKRDATEAEHDAENARRLSHRANTLQREAGEQLIDCVGANVQRRVLLVNNSEVVIVQYKGSDGVAITLEKLT